MGHNSQFEKLTGNTVSPAASQTPASSAEVWVCVPLSVCSVLGLLAHTSTSSSQPGVVAGPSLSLILGIQSHHKSCSSCNLEPSRTFHVFPCPLPPGSSHHPVSGTDNPGPTSPSASPHTQYAPHSTHPQGSHSGQRLHPPLHTASHICSSHTPGFPLCLGSFS